MSPRPTPMHRLVTLYECQWCGGHYHPVSGPQPVGVYCSTRCRSDWRRHRERRVRELIEAAASRAMPPRAIAAELAKLSKRAPKRWDDRKGNAR